MRYSTLIATAGSLLVLGGCAASASPDWDAQFGDPSRMLKAQQLIDPDAPARHAQLTPPTDGRTTQEAMMRHVESYRTPPPTTVINIGNIGTGR